MRRARRRPSTQFAEGVRRFIIGLAQEDARWPTRWRWRPTQVFGIPADRADAGLAWLGIVCYSAADLLRLLRLLRHGHRPGADVRLRLPRELRLALPRRSHHRVLAALAHLAVELVPRLPLHPARRQPRGRAADLLQPDDHDLPRRPLARGELELRRSGACSTARSWSLERMGLGRRLEALWSPLRHAYLCWWCSSPGSSSAHEPVVRPGLPVGDGGVRLRYGPRLLPADVLESGIDPVPAGRGGGGLARPAADGPGARARPGANGWRAAADCGLSSALALFAVAVQMVLLVACAAELASGTHNPFIYFRF